MLTDDITVRYDVIVFLLELLRKGNSAATVCVIQVVELLLRVFIQRIHAVCVCCEDDDLNLQVQYVILIVVTIDIGIADTLIT